MRIIDELITVCGVFVCVSFCCHLHLSIRPLHADDGFYKSIFTVCVFLCSLCFLCLRLTCQCWMCVWCALIFYLFNHSTVLGQINLLVSNSMFTMSRIFNNSLLSVSSIWLSFSPSVKLLLLIVLMTTRISVFLSICRLLITISASAYCCSQLRQIVCDESGLLKNIKSMICLICHIVYVQMLIKSQI